MTMLQARTPNNWIMLRSMDVAPSVEFDSHEQVFIPSMIQDLQELAQQSEQSYAPKCTPQVFKLGQRNSLDICEMYCGDVCETRVGTTRLRLEMGRCCARVTFRIVTLGCMTHMDVHVQSPFGLLTGYMNVPCSSCLTAGRSMM
jgi:hypothetical protein